MFANPFLYHTNTSFFVIYSTYSHRKLISSALISLKFMDAMSSDHLSPDAQAKDGDDAGGAKRLLEVLEGTTLPEPKRAKTSSGENPDIDPGNVPGPSRTSEATRKPQRGKQNEKNKGRRRGTRPPVEDDPDRPRAPRLPKKQCAVLIGFSGTNYAGMQMYVWVLPLP